MGGHRTRFCGRAAENVPLMHVPLFLRGLGQVSKWNVCGRRKEALKIRFYRIYIEISVTTTYG